MEHAGRLVIRRSRWKATLWSLVCLVFVAGGIILAQPGTLGAVLVGDGGAVFFGLGVLIFARDALKPRVQLVLSPEGLEQRAIRPHVLIPWSQIKDVTVIKRSHGVKTLGITVRDPSLLPRHRLRERAQRSRWPGRVVKLLLAAVEVLYSGPSGIRDAISILREDVSPHATFELAMTGMPMNAKKLRQQLLKRRDSELS